MGRKESSQLGGKKLPDGKRASLHVMKLSGEKREIFPVGREEASWWEGNKLPVGQCLSCTPPPNAATGNLANANRADKNLHADIGVVKIFQKNPNFSKKLINYNYWPPVQCACVISKFWQSSIHIFIFLLLRLSSLVPILTYRVSGSADGDFAVIWYKYYVAGSFGL